MGSYSFMSNSKRHRSLFAELARDRMLVLAACYLTILAVGQNSTAIMAALPAMTSDFAFGPATGLVRATAVAPAARHILSQAAAYATSARHSANAAERLCL
jgi:hypothetical protein